MTRTAYGLPPQYAVATLIVLAGLTAVCAQPYAPPKPGRAEAEPLKTFTEVTHGYGVMSGSKICRICRVGIACGDKCIHPLQKHLCTAPAGCAHGYFPLHENDDDFLLGVNRAFKRTDFESVPDDVISEFENKPRPNPRGPLPVPNPGLSRTGFVETQSKSRNAVDGTLQPELLEMEAAATWDLLGGIARIKGKKQVHETITKAAGGTDEAYIAGVRFNDMPSGSDNEPATDHLSLMQFGKDFAFGDPGRLVWETHYGCLQHWHAMCPESRVNDKILAFSNQNVRFFVMQQALFWWKQALEMTAWQDLDNTGNGDASKFAKLTGYGDFFIGHILHVVQDAFAEGHTVRAGALPVPDDDLNPLKRTVPTGCGRLFHFQAYGAQEGNEGHGVYDHEPEPNTRTFTMRTCAEFYSSLVLDHWKACKRLRLSDRTKEVPCPEQWTAVKNILLQQVLLVAEPVELAGGTLAQIAAPPAMLPKYYKQETVKLPLLGDVPMQLIDSTYSKIRLWDSFSGREPLPTLCPPIIAPGGNDVVTTYGPLFTPLTFAMALGEEEQSTPENQERLDALWKDVSIDFKGDTETERIMAMMLAALKVYEKAAQVAPEYAPTDLQINNVQPGQSYRDQPSAWTDTTYANTECYPVAGQRGYWMLVPDGDCQRTTLLHTCNWANQCVSRDDSCGKAGGVCACDVQKTNKCRCVKQILGKCKVTDPERPKAMSFTGHGGHGHNEAPGTGPEPSSCFAIAGRDGFYETVKAGRCKRTLPLNPLQSRDAFMNCFSRAHCRDQDGSCETNGGECACEYEGAVRWCRCIRKVTTHCDAKLLKKEFK